MTDRTTFTILWQHDGAHRFEVVVDADLSAFGPLEQRIRGIASIASSHASLRMLLESAFADRLDGQRKGDGRLTTVRLVPE